MPYECNDCGMDFETTGELVNHKKRFCDANNGDYATPASLDRRLDELRNMDDKLGYDYKARLAEKRAAAPVS